MWVLGCAKGSESRARRSGAHIWRRSRQGATLGPGYTLNLVSLARVHAHMHTHPALGQPQCIKLKWPENAGREGFGH